jgi:hypothetical protein
MPAGVSLDAATASAAAAPSTGSSFLNFLGDKYAQSILFYTI